MNDIDDGRLRAYLDGELDAEAVRRIDRILEDKSSQGAASIRRRFDALQELDARAEALLELSDAPREGEPQDVDEAWAAMPPRERDAESGSRRVPSRRVMAMATIGMLAAAALALVILWPQASVPQHGEHEVTARSSFDVASRAVAVAEAGSALRWIRDDDDRVVVTQSSGSVFYRVHEGGPFEVVTPAGTVTALGTCFTVELDANTMNDMKKRSAAMVAAGVAMGAVLTLTVHEGSAVLASEGTSLTLEAGESATSHKGRSPQEANTDAATLSEKSLEQVEQAEVVALREQTRQQQRELEALREQLAQVDPSEAAKPKDEATLHKELVQKCATSVGLEECDSMVDEPEVLAEMARCATIRAEYPSFLSADEGGFEPKKSLRDLVDLSQKEVDAMTSANEAFTRRYVEDLESMLRDAGIEPETIAASAPLQQRGKALARRLEKIEEDVSGQDIRRLIAQERAGQRDPPSRNARQSSRERFERRRANLAEAYETALGDALGEVRAHELRVAGDGWGHTLLMVGDCDEQQSP